MKNLVSTKQKALIVHYLLLVLALYLTYKSVGSGYVRAMNGQDALVWLHVLIFFVAIFLVILAIVIKSKYTK